MTTLLCFQMQKLTFCSVNRNRRQWTVEHLHVTAGDFTNNVYDYDYDYDRFEKFHKCSDSNIIQGLEVSRF